MYRILVPEQKELCITLPTSKSVTHRIFILAALNKGKTIVEEPLIAEDTNLTLQALGNMGVVVKHNMHKVEFRQPLGKVNDPEIFLGNSGSSARFLIPLAAFLDKPVRFAGIDRLHERPFSELFSALQALGIRSETTDNSLPAIVHPGKMNGGKLAFARLPSSQIITAFMLAALWMEKDLELILPEQTPSLSYIAMTYRLMRRLDLPVQYEHNQIMVGARKPDFDWHFRVEKDFSAASYWVIYSLIHRAKVIFPGVTLPSFQGDEKIFAIAEELGARIMLYPDRMEIEGDLNKGMVIDCNAIPDLVPALSVLAMFAPEPFTLTNIKHLEYKESNRVAAIQQNIGALGGKSHYQKNNLTVSPQQSYNNAIIDSFDDHRIAMSFAIAGTKIPGTIIRNPECTNKSYPRFWQDFKSWEVKRNG